MESLLTVNDISSRVKKSCKTIYAHIAEGKIPAKWILRIEGSIRMRPIDFEKWLESGRGNKNGRR